MDEKIDATLVALSRAGDTAAFNLLLERYQVMASCIALRLVPEEEIARELVQEAMLQAYLSLDHLRDDTRFKSWFYGIVLNICRRFLSRRKRGALSLDSPSSSWLCEVLRGDSPFVDPQEIVEEQELQELVRAAVELLSPRNRDTAILFYYDNLSTQQIARRLGISQTAVRNRLYKARDQLRDYLKSLYPEIETRHLPATAGKQRRGYMIKVTIARVVQEKSSALLLFLDEKQQRVMPYWLWLDDGLSYTPVERMMRSTDQPGSTSDTRHTLDFVLNILKALDSTVEAVHIDSLRDCLLYGLLQLRTPQGTRTVKTDLLNALPLAMHLNCPLFIAEEPFERLGVGLPAGDEALEQQFDAVVHTISKHSWTFTPRSIISYTPRNLDFTAGLLGWSYYLERFQPDVFDWQVDSQNVHTGIHSLSIRLRDLPLNGRSSNQVCVMHEGFLADNYCGKRVRLTAAMKAVDVSLAYLHLQIVGSTNPVTFERTVDEATMKDKPIQGTTDWQLCELLIDVPTDATTIQINLVLQQKGQLWLNNLTFEVVDA